jgi:hypothetical protein
MSEFSKENLGLTLQFLREVGCGKSSAEETAGSKGFTCAFSTLAA